MVKQSIFRAEEHFKPLLLSLLCPVLCGWVREQARRGFAVQPMRLQLLKSFVSQQTLLLHLSKQHVMPFTMQNRLL